MDKYSALTVGYGQNGVCWITSGLALICIFVVPVGLILTVNVTLLLITVINIQRSMRLSEAVNMTYSGREKLAIYIRLTSIIGITWIFGFLSNIPGLHYMVYPFIVFNGSQGVIVCMAFCSSSRVRDLCSSYCQCWTKPTRRTTATTTRTPNTV
jgi:hypothetical protein